MRCTILCCRRLHKCWRHWQLWLPEQVDFKALSVIVAIEETQMVRRTQLPIAAIQEVQVALLLASIAMWMGLQHVVPRRCLVAHSSEGHQTPVGLQHVVPQRCFVATQRPLLSLRYVSAAQESRSISSAHLQGHSVLQILDMCTAMFLNYRLVVR